MDSVTYWRPAKIQLPTCRSARRVGSTDASYSRLGTAPVGRFDRRVCYRNRSRPAAPRGLGRFGAGRPGTDQLSLGSTTPASGATSCTGARRLRTMRANARPIATLAACCGLTGNTLTTCVNALLSDHNDRSGNHSRCRSSRKYVATSGSMRRFMTGRSNAKASKMSDPTSVGVSDFARQVPRG